MAIQATIIGNLGADARLVTLGQTQALEFNMGSRRSRKDKNGNPVTDWVQVTYFSTALQQWLTKGRTVVVTGELEVSSYTSQQGEIRIGMKVVAKSIEFAGGANPDGQANQQTVAQPVAQQSTQQAQFTPPPAQDGGALPF